MFPAAREGDPATHDLTIPSGTIAPPVVPCPSTMGPVIIEGLPAAHVGCSVICTGATALGPAHSPPPPGMPPPIVMIGSPTVLIHGKPAARWAPSGDLTACGAFLGDPRLAATRTVIIGNGVSVTTSLGLAVDLLVSLSPSLSSDVNSILKAGWTFSKGLPGKGSFARRDTKTIVIDPDDVNDTRTLVQTLAHEVGHARFVHPPYRPPSGLTREEYVRKNLENDLTDEGAANFSNARARGEITASGGPDIGIAGSQQERYQSIYDEYQAGRIDQPTAEQKMGALFGRGERTSTTNELYEDYYGKGYRKFWDTNLGNVPPGGKAP